MDDVTQLGRTLDAPRPFVKPATGTHARTFCTTLAAPHDSGGWSSVTPPFALFRWDEIGNGFGAYRWPQSMVLDANDDPAVASVFGDLINSDGAVSRWTAGAWQQVGGSVAPHLPNFGHSLAITPGLAAGFVPLSLAYRWYTAGTKLAVALSEWDGTAWADRGGPAGVQHASDPVMIVSSHGAKVVAFAEQVSGGRSRVYVHAWDGVGWSKVGGPPVRKGSTWNPSLASDAQGNVLLACELTGFATRPASVVVVSWDGARWTQLGKPIPSARRPRIAVGRGGHVVLGFIDFAATPSPVTRCARWNGTSWQQLASIINRPVSFSVAVAIGGTPVVAYENPTVPQQRIEVAWVGTTSTATFSPSNPVGTGTSSAPLIALDSLDLPVLCWAEGDPSVFEGPDPSRLIRAARLVPDPQGPG